MTRRLLRYLIAPLLLIPALPALAGARVDTTTGLQLELAGGTVLRVITSPLAFVLTKADGQVVVSTSRQDSLGWVAGAATTVTDPAPPFMGDDAAGVRAGAYVAAGDVTSAQVSARRLSLTVATIAGPAQLSVWALPSGGAALQTRPPARLPVASTILRLSSPPGEALFGLGGRHDAFDQRGLVRTGWSEEQNSGAGPASPASDPVLGPGYTFPNGSQSTYYPQAVLFGLRGWSLWELSSARYDVDLAHTLPDLITWAVDSAVVTWGIAGGGLDAASAAFTGTMGRAPAPPAWTHLPWIDVINQNDGEAAPMGSGFTGGPRVAADVRAIAAAASAYHLPVGVIGMEGWQAVPHIAALASSLRRAGFHLSAYWNPFISPSNPAFPPAAKAGLLVRTPTGSPYPVLTTRGSADRALDFTNPASARFWAKQVARSCALGFEGWMEDFGEFVTEGMRFSNGASPDAEHNAYPEQYHRAGVVAEQACRKVLPAAEPFFYVRAGFTTTPSATAGAFPGDETTDWSASSGIASVVPEMLNLALGGATAFTTDVGGYLDLYTPRTSPELLIRWEELAAFTSVMRIHNSTYHGELYPWQAGPTALDVYRRYARAKVRLAPLVDRLSLRAARTGEVGPVRPLVLVDPSAAAAQVDDEWLLGDDLLVAPVLTPNTTRRSVYLPRGGRWQQERVAENGTLVPFGPAYAGGRRVVVAAPLAVIPLFARR